MGRAANSGQEREAQVGRGLGEERGLYIGCIVTRRRWLAPPFEFEPPVEECECG